MAKTVCVSFYFQFAKKIKSRFGCQIAAVAGKRRPLNVAFMPTFPKRPIQHLCWSRFTDVNEDALRFGREEHHFLSLQFIYDQSPKALTPTGYAINSTLFLLTQLAKAIFDTNMSHWRLFLLFTLSYLFLSLLTMAPTRQIAQRDSPTMSFFCSRVLKVSLLVQRALKFRASLDQRIFKT
jgi:hypothetical protein